MDTIFALATARGKAGIAIVRLSGPLAHEAVRRLAGDVPPPRIAALRALRDAGGVLDSALVLTFTEGASFTGESAAELHLHGSSAVVASVHAALGGMDGLRLAEPGEFTRRALENGKLDLAQVEGLADLIDAETEAQRRQALRVLSGAVGKRAEVWRRDLVRAAALLEASIDFADEDVPSDVRPEVSTLLSALIAALGEELRGVRIAERVRDGFEVAIVGRPNVGKSTLLNALAGREAAITSEIAGTTRDVIEVRMDLGGCPVTLLDTAGLREATDGIESIGMERALRRAGDADLRIFLLDASGLPEGLTPLPQDIVAYGKADLGAEGFAVSGKTGEGLDSLVDRIAAVLATRVASTGTFTRERHRRAMESAVGALDRARLELSRDPARLEIAAEEVRSATRALDSLVGRIGVEAVLGEIFASFCIGK